MKLLSIGAVFAGAAFAALACRGDPTSSLRGGPKYVDLSANVIILNVGDTRGLEVVVRDEQLNPLDASVAALSRTPDTATVVADSTFPLGNGSIHNFLVTGVGTGTTWVVVTSGGLKDSAAVIVQ